MNEISYTLIRSQRKTVALQITPNGLVVRAPQQMSAAKIQEFVKAHADWIQKHLPAAPCAKLSETEKAALKLQAQREIPPRVAAWAKKIGVSYGKITIRFQSTRWGSCSAAGNLNFNALLLLAPPEVLDSVLVHELCHRREMNHSPAFYREVLRVMPDYPERHQWLKHHGAELMGRL